jgi:hypothetical protein
MFLNLLGIRKHACEKLNHWFEAIGLKVVEELKVITADMFTSIVKSCELTFVECQNLKQVIALLKVMGPFGPFLGAVAAILISDLHSSPTTTN